MNHFVRLTALIAAAGCIAQAGANEHIENLVATASRTPLPAARVGSAVSVVDRELIENRQAILLTDILQDLPGIAVSRAGGPGAQTQLRMRGAEANHLLVVIDGVVANDPAMSDEFSFEHLTAWDIERLEVVRGPQSALWGSDALAGVINVTTRREDADTPRGSGFFEGGSFDSVNLGGSLGIRLAEINNELSLSWFDTEGENVARSGDEKDGYDNLTATWRADLQATDALRFGLNLRHTDATSEFDDTFRTGLPVDADLTTDTTLNFVRGFGRLDLLDDRWQHELSLGYEDSDRQNFDAGDSTDVLKGERIGISYQTSWDFTNRPNEYRLIAALDYDDEEFEQVYAALSGADQRQQRDSLGVIAEFLAQPLEAMNLSASIRHDDNSGIKDKTSYRLTASYELSATNTRLHSSFGTGMKKPTFVELFGFFPDSFIPNPNLKPEESEGFDFGIQQSLFDGRGLVDITWFYSELTDEISTVFLPSFESTVINEQGTSRRQGIEVDLQLRLLEGLDARASYTYTDAREPRPDSGKRTEIRRPRNMAALNLNYELPGERVNLNLNLSYTGEQKDQDFSQFPAPIVTLDDYTLVNLAASYALTESIVMYARAENLFDESYENLFGYRAPGAGYYAGIRLAVR